MLGMRAICLWPGLPAACIGGMLRGLVVALVFAWCVCLLLLATFVWPEWVANEILRGMWLAIICAWFAGLSRNFWRLPGLLQVSDSQGGEAFVEAQREYLLGNWFDAEAILLELLHRHPRDAEAMLLLVGVLRHTQRWRPALRRLEQLELLDTSAPWRFEITREKSLIERAMAEEATV